MIWFLTLSGSSNGAPLASWPSITDNRSSTSSLRPDRWPAINSSKNVCRVVNSPVNAGVTPFWKTSPSAAVKLAGMGAIPSTSNDSNRAPKPASATVSIASFCRSVDTSTASCPAAASHRLISWALMSSIAE